MANVKISALPAAAAVTADDLYAIVNDPGGTPELQKATHTQALTFFQAQILAAANTFTGLNTFPAAGMAVGSTTLAHSGGYLTINTAFKPTTTNARDLGATGERWKDSFFAGAMLGRTASFVAIAVGDITLIARGFTAQTGNLQEWRDVSSNVLSTITENGYFTTRKITIIADAELAASEVALWFDSTDGAGKLKIKGKTANGTVVVGEVALA